MSNDEYLYLSTSTVSKSLEHARGLNYYSTV